MFSFVIEDESDHDKRSRDWRVDLLRFALTGKRNSTLLLNTLTQLNLLHLSNAKHGIYSPRH